MNNHLPFDPTGYLKIRKLALIVGIIGLAIAGFGLFQGLVNNDSRMVASWLLGFGIWFSISIGLLLIVTIWWLFDAGWSTVLRRQAEHAIGVFPWLGLIFLPLILIAWFHSNPGILWEWMNPDFVLPGKDYNIGHDPIYVHKAGFLNKTFFTIRAVIYFSVFTFFASRYRKYSYTSDNEPSTRWYFKCRFISAIAIFAVALSATFAAFDFFMSIHYQWFSTMYGVWFFATSMRSGLVAIMLITAFLATKGYLRDGQFREGHMYNLGCMFLAFTIFWAYISFCQFFLIYNANIPEETFWFNIREVNYDGAKNSWWPFSLALIFCYFFIPFFILLMYKTKVIMKRMIFVSCWIFTFFMADMYWNIIPRKLASGGEGYLVQQFYVTPWDVAMIVGVGGIFIWSLLGSLVKHQPIPINDPRIKECLNYIP